MPIVTVAMGAGRRGGLEGWVGGEGVTQSNLQG